jgi:IPT/TIG domain
MKVNSLLLITAFVLAVSLVVVIGCKYDVAEPKYFEPEAAYTTVTINSIDPAQEAVPGVNTITIHGSGFDGAIDPMVVHNASTNSDTTIVYQGVYFGNVPAEVVAISSTSITMRRPDLVSDSCIIKVLSDKALVNAKIGPYKIDAVKSQSGAFLDNLALSTVTIDALGNLYVIKQVAPCTIYKVTPAGDKTAIGIASYVPTDAKIGSDGNLYYLNSQFQKRIYMANVNGSATTKDSLWGTAAKNVKFGDFDANSYFYAGGAQSGIVVVRPDRSSRVESYYASDTILSVRVFNQYLYIAVRGAIYRHSISDTSQVGNQELVLDLTQGVFGSRSIKAFSFSADGSKMYIGTDSPDPILIATDAMNIPITSDRVDILYKNILPSYCKQFCFGNKLYMISGNAAPAVNWTLYQVDVGTTGAPYY